MEQNGNSNDGKTFLKVLGWNLLVFVVLTGLVAVVFPRKSDPLDFTATVLGLGLLQGLANILLGAHAYLNEKPRLGQAFLLLGLVSLVIGPSFCMSALG